MIERKNAEMEKKIYFLSPLEAEMYERTNESADPDDVWSGQDLLEYQKEIRKAIEERNQWAGANLMEYYDKNDSVKEKVKSLELTVVEHDGELKGCAIATVSLGLDSRELDQVKDYLTGQYADGWGEGFEQMPVQAGDIQMYVHFWNWKNFRFEILLGIDLQEQTEKPGQSRLEMNIDLKGPDGNIYAVEGKAIQILREAGREKEAVEMDCRIRESGSYYRALDIINEYVRIEPDYRKQLQLKSEKKKADRER